MTDDTMTNDSTTLAQQIRTACQAHGLDLSEKASEMILAELGEAGAKTAADLGSSFLARAASKAFTRVSGELVEHLLPAKTPAQAAEDFWRSKGIEWSGLTMTRRLNLIQEFEKHEAQKAAVAQGAAPAAFSPGPDAARPKAVPMQALPNSGENMSAMDRLNAVNKATSPDVQKLIRRFHSALAQSINPRATFEERSIADKIAESTRKSLLGWGVRL